MIMKDCKRRLTSLAFVWIDYRKAYDMVPHSWIEKCMEVFDVAVNANFFCKRINEAVEHRTDCR